MLAQTHDSLALDLDSASLLLCLHNVTWARSCQCLTLTRELRLLACRDVVFVNEDEAAAISGLPVPGAAEAVPAARWFNERGAALTVVTLGCVCVALPPPGKIAAVWSAVLVLD
eukprot:COSAG04_NODE_1111_length_8227_cov_4.702510_6_plen_114_part_00